ncbi:MAG TPA: hypothetical protein VFW96_16525 [Thermomicrobiales bacterium]|nr:hypothetical protein [Thermomicrobiales bacterium]
MATMPGAVAGGAATDPLTIQQPEYDERVRRVRAALAARRLDALVLFHPIRMARRQQRPRPRDRPRAHQRRPRRTRAPAPAPPASPVAPPVGRAPPTPRPRPPWRGRRAAAA